MNKPTKMPIKIEKNRPKLLGKLINTTSRIPEVIAETTIGLLERCPISNEINNKGRAKPKEREAGITGPSKTPSAQLNSHADHCPKATPK